MISVLYLTLKENNDKGCTRSFNFICLAGHAVHSMHFLHRRRVKILQKSRASFPHSIGRVAIFRDAGAGAALSLWTARAKQVCTRSIFEYRMPSGIV